jgi:signal peptidase I
MTAENKKAIKDVASGLLGEGKTIRIEASGYSMYPSIRPGNIIHIKAISEPEKVDVGDIIAWQREKDMVVHRLVHRYRHDDDCHYITRGDSAISSDKPVSFNDVAGKVVLIENRKGSKVPLAVTLIRESRYRINNKKVWLVVRIRAVLRKMGM